MSINKSKLTWAACLALLSVGAFGQNLTVTSPTSGSFLGQTNQLKFTVTGANVEVVINARVEGPGGVTNIEGNFTPNAQGEIDNNLSLNFSESAPEGAYTITVTGKRKDNNVIFGTSVINVTVDVIKPKFLQFNPISSGFVRGVVPIVVKVLEPNFKDYRVQINSQDIPNNTGTDLFNDIFTVNWDTSGILFDGSQTIGIRLRDEAQNEANQSISVTLDRIQPSATITHPQANVRLRARSSFSVSIDIADASTSSVDFSGVDVVARTMNGGYLTRVARSSFRPAGNVLRWTGRVRWRSSFPKEFKIVVNVRDKAGNVGTQQELIVRYK